MSATDTNPIPSRMMLQNLQIKRKAAFQGYTLLKKKVDALTSRFRGMLKDIVRTKRELGEAMNDAAFALAKADYATTNNFRLQVTENVRRPAVVLNVESENVAGVKLPIFTIQIDPTVDVMGMIGIASGGQVIQNARDAYLKALSALIKLAALQVAFFTLDMEIRMTNRRVNALDNVVVPRLDSGVAYIKKELDEQEREEFFRLKKIQEKKKPTLEDEKNQCRTGTRASEAAASMLKEEDADIVF